MNYPTFIASLSQPSPPLGLSLALQGLWWDAKGDWDRAHDCAQKREDAAGNRLHAYLHRKEGDIGNAGYWYRRAGVSPFSGTLEAEWEALAREWLAQG